MAPVLVSAEAAAIDEMLCQWGYRIAPMPSDIEVRGGRDDWRVVTPLTSPRVEAN